MPATWIVLSTRWSLSSVQAALNVIISVLATIGLWAFGRFWWRRGGIAVLRGQTGVRLSKLFTISSPGESWDVVVTLGRNIFARDNWHLLVQLVVVVGVSVACAMAGPIAKVSLRTGLTTRSTELQVMQSVKGGGYFGNLLFASVLWNDTAQSLKDADFPADQLLDFLPPPTDPPWVYHPTEWQPTWTATCNYTDEIVLHNVTGSGQHNIFNPVDAFPEFRATIDPHWLDPKKFRMTSDYNSWQNWHEEKQFQEVLFYVLMQSNPTLDDRMYHNNETLQLSLSVLHARGFRVLYSDTSGIGGEDTWLPVGPVTSAVYSRAECELIRKPTVRNEDTIPWPWTNDTQSIMSGYRNFFHDPFARAAVKKRKVDTPSARDLFRFYQVYMASINTFHSDPTPRTLSVKMQTVELSTIFLAVLLFFFLLTIWSTMHYAWFLRRNEQQLRDLFVPDGKMGWMIHAVKSSESGIDLEANDNIKVRKDGEHFCAATFGSTDMELHGFNPELKVPKLARVMSSRSSVSSITAAQKYSHSPARSFTTNLFSLNEGFRPKNGSENNLERYPTSSDSSITPSITVSVDDDEHRGRRPNQDDVPISRHPIIYGNSRSLAAPSRFMPRPKTLPRTLTPT